MYLPLLSKPTGSQSYASCTVYIVPSKTCGVYNVGNIFFLLSHLTCAHASVDFDVICSV